MTLKALCVARTSGRLVRDLTLFEVDEPVVICAANSFASPTPVVDEERVYCEFGALGTACLEADTGHVIWSRKLVVDHQVGPGSSPVVYGNLLILVRDGIDQQYVTALDKATGATVWQTNRPSLSGTLPTLRKAFSTPLVFRADGREQLVATGARWIVSYEPATGKELWCVDTGGTFSNASRPVYGCGLIFAGTSYGDSALRAIRPDGRGDVTATHVVWQQQRSVPKLSSPWWRVTSCFSSRTTESHPVRMRQWSRALDRTTVRRLLGSTRFRGWQNLLFRRRRHDHRRASGPAVRTVGRESN